MGVVAIIQARMGSTRLPGKVMRLLAGKPMIQRVTERVQRARKVDQVVVATTTLKEDDALADFVAKQLPVRVTRGPWDDVLTRYHEAAVATDASTIVRITSDCPLLSPQVTARVIEEFHREKCDYASNAVVRTYPRGLDTEVMTRAALDRSNREAKDPADREHVTQYINDHPDLFRMHDVVDSEDHSDLRWTVDTEDDFRLVEKIYGHFGTNAAFEYADVLDLIRKNPSWSEINRHVEQKKR
jgi:spore coat polysaccharide biosynthesis protein SpsF